MKILDKKVKRRRERNWPKKSQLLMMRMMRLQHQRKLRELSNRRRRRSKTK
jgi:hypothetical protein